MFHSFCCRRDARISVRVRFVHLQTPRLLNRMGTASAVQYRFIFRRNKATHNLCRCQSYLPGTVRSMSPSPMEVKTQQDENFVAFRSNQIYRERHLEQLYRIRRPLA